MAKALSDEKVATILAKAISNSEHTADGKMAQERLEVDKYLQGSLPLPQHKGDSKYVSRDVFDAVDSMRATILEAFMANSRIVFFRPEYGETVEEAKQATEYTRHVFFKENNGEEVLYDALTDGLTKRFSCVKVYYKSVTEEEEYEFEGVTPEELTSLVSEYENYEFVDADISENGLYNGSFEVKTDKGTICVEAVQPEDLLVSSRTTDLMKAKYVIHRVSKSKSDLLKEGYDEKKVEEIVFSGSTDLDLEYEKQHRFEAIDDIISTDDGYDDSVQEATVHECYIRLDMDGSGKNKLWRVIYVNGVILEKEQISRIPFVAFVPLPIPHTFFGENFAKNVIPIQNARTVLIRQIINHTMLTNNPRLQVLSGTVQNPNELLENRMGGLVNVRRMDGIAPLPQAPMNPYVFNLIQMIDADKEEVTGTSKLSQGMNKDAISTQNAQGMVEQLISASQQRSKIITRLFGKFLKDVYHLIYHTAIDYIDEADYVEVTGAYVEVQPKLWKERKAASIELTAGYGEQEMEAQKWTEIDMYFSQDPTLSAGYDYAKRYEVVTRSLEKRGIEDISTILTPPDQMQPPEPSEAETLQLEQMKSQIKYQNAQSEAMTMKAQSDRMSAEANLIKARADAGLKQVQTELAPQEFAHEQYVDRTEIELAKLVPESGQRSVLNPS